MTESCWLKDHDSETQAKLMATVTEEQRSSILKHLAAGANVQGAKTVGEALTMAKADFTVDKFPTMAVLPATEEGGEPTALPIDGEAAVVATWPDGKQEAFGSVGATYRCIQNIEAFGAAEILAEQGVFQPLSVEMNHGGAHVHMQGLIGASTLALPSGPTTLAHLGRFETSHDGTRSTQAALYTINMMCLNGMTSLEMAARQTVRHTARADKRMEQATAILLGIQHAAVLETELYAKLATRKMGKKAFASFAEELLNEVRGRLTDDTKEHVKARREAQVQELLGYFNEPEMGAHGQTAFDGYQAITRWLSPRQERYEDAAAHARALASNREGHASNVRHRAQRLLISRAR